jgi:hypothetical protein
MPEEWDDPADQEFIDALREYEQRLTVENYRLTAGYDEPPVN